MIYKNFPYIVSPKGKKKESGSKLMEEDFTQKQRKIFQVIKAQTEIFLACEENLKRWHLKPFF